MRAWIPKRVYQVIAQLLLLLSLLLSAYWWVAQSGPVRWLRTFGLDANQAGISTVGLMLLGWIVTVFPLRIMTDFGEPLIPDRLFLTRTQAELQPKNAREAERQLGIGGLATAAFCAILVFVFWAVGLGLNIGAVIFGVFAFAAGLWHLWRTWRLS